MRFGSPLLAVAVTSCFLAIGNLAFAQSATTSLRGTVADPKRAVVAGAKVTLNNPPTGFSRTAQTDDQGIYQFLDVPPSTYVIEASAAGFATTKRDSVPLQVSSPATVNLVLQVQGGSVIVDVSGEAPQVNTTDATLGNNFNSRQLIDLPAEGRDPAAILSLQPGVVYVGSKVDQNDDSRSGAVNGARSDQSNITLDGLDDNDQLEGYAFQGAMRATLDSLQEFRVVTSNYDAGSGRSSGAQVNLVTKSGTNAIHGSLYEYYRPSFDVANDWFNKKAELGAGRPNVPGFILRNTFGATFGGPLKKDRLFYFAAYEGQRTADQEQTTRIVPTASLAAGELTYLCAPSSTCKDGNSGNIGSAQAFSVAADSTYAPDLVATLYPAGIASIDAGCAANGTCPPTPGSAGPGPNGLIANIGGANPSSLFSKYPLPNCTACGNPTNGDGDGLNSAGYTFPGNDPRKLDTYIFKLDYKISADGNHSLFLRGNLQNDHEAQPPQFPGMPPNDFVTNNSKGIAAGHIYLHNNVINNMRYAFIRQGLGDTGLNNQDFIRLRGLDDTQGLTNIILSNVPVNNFIDDVSVTKGKHTIGFGTNWRLIHNNRQSNAENISEGYANLYWMFPSFISGTGASLDPAINPAFPVVDPSFGTSYDFAAVQVTGLISQVYTVSNQDKFANNIPNGELV